jgi:hypothetical protein
MKHSDNENTVNFKRMQFPQIGLELPSDSIIHELINSPRKETLWIENTKAEYNSPSNNLGSSALAQKLEVVLSLRDYEIPYRNPLEPKSLSLVSMFNDEVLRLIKEDLTDINPFNVMEASFCTEKSINYQLVQYHKAVIFYCLEMLPHPLNYIKNVDKDNELSIFDAGEFEQRQSNGEFQKPKNPKLLAYEERKVEAGRRARSIFCDYRKSEKQLGYLSHLIITERPEILQARFNKNYDTVTNNRAHQRSKRPKDKDLLLCRCEFCYRFHTIERGRGRVNPAWHCPWQRCGNQYRHWVNGLQKKSISLEKLYQTDL